MEKLSVLLDELERKIPECEKQQPAVSKASVGWHIEHTLLTLNTVIGRLQKSDPKGYAWSFSFPRLLVFAMKKIPRGKAQSPASVQPRNDFTPMSLKAHLDDTKRAIAVLPHLPPNNYIEHPVFGKLNRAATIRFLRIHTKHHMVIINDILKAAH